MHTLRRADCQEFLTLKKNYLTHFQKIKAVAPLSSYLGGSFTVKGDDLRSS
jgi:hypothetical protein